MVILVLDPSELADFTRIFTLLPAVKRLSFFNLMRTTLTVDSEIFVVRQVDQRLQRAFLVPLAFLTFI